MCRVLILCALDGVPKVYYYGQYGDYNILVMDLVGPSLDELFEYCNSKLSLDAVLHIGVQMVSILERIHSFDYVHRDVKPGNMAIGLGTSANTLYLLDYGLAKRYKALYTRKHIPYDSRKHLVGTLVFASVNAHLGVAQTRRDDLESLGFTMLYFLLGALPWQDVATKSKRDCMRKVAKLKMKTDVKDLCRCVSGIIFPSENVENIPKYFEHVRGLVFEGRPDYQYLRKVLAPSQAEFQFDWLRKTPSYSVSSSSKKAR